jgi:SOS-response transcriptional repressor LexA
MQPLTPRQTDLVSAVRRHWATRRIPPTLADLADTLDLSISRTSTLVEECQAKGVIARDPGKYRSIRPAASSPRRRPRSA